MAARCGVGLRTERLEPDSCTARETSGSTQTDYPRGVALIGSRSDRPSAKGRGGLDKAKIDLAGSG